MAKLRIRRSNAANARLHAIIERIAQQKTWAGQHWPVATWRRLLLAAWLRTREQDAAELLPALDGNGIDIVWHSNANLGQDDFAEFADFVRAWAELEGIDIEQKAPPVKHPAPIEKMPKSLICHAITL